jgi:uncharacterized protein YciI
VLLILATASDSDITTNHLRRPITDEETRINMHRQFDACFLSTVVFASRISPGPPTDDGQESRWIPGIPHFDENDDWTMRTSGFFLLLLTMVLSIPIRAQEPPGPDYGMKTLFLCFLNKGDGWHPERTESADVHLKLHEQFWSGLQAKGIAILRGPIVDTLETREIVVLEVDSLPTALRIVSDDPLVKLGWLKPDVRAWFAGRKVIVTTGNPDSAVTYFFGLLTRGPAWTPEQTPEIQKLQEAHMANIRALAEKKKLVLAGPFVDGKEMRGVFIFEVPTINEAMSLSLTDPAIQAGRLAVTLHPWVLPAGSFRLP